MERQTVGAQVINNTLLSCVISSLQKINEFYTGASTLKNSNRWEPKCRVIEVNDFMTVQTYIMKKDYASLHQVLGHVLPEITEDTYYEKNLVKAEFINKDKLTMKDMRNVITWQLWIEHLISYFPSFSTIHAKDMTKKQQWKRLGNSLYSNHQQIPFLEGKDLGIYDYVLLNMKYV